MPSRDRQGFKSVNVFLADYEVLRDKYGVDWAKRVRELISLEADKIKWSKRKP